MAAPWPEEFQLDNGTVLRWQPIAPYAELEVRERILKAEFFQVKMLHQGHLFSTQTCNRARTHTDEARRTKRTEQAHRREKQALDDAIYSNVFDKIDHSSMRAGRMPASEKRRPFSLRICKTLTAYSDPVERNRRRRAWIRAHQPPDVRVELRAKAREQWRKAAYLVGIVSFWVRVACAPGSRGACAAVARVEKRAREM